MSYREMRTFTEIMRSLGYNRIISMENFRLPNFPLVAEILSWLVSRYDAEAELPNCLDTEQDRVIFLKMVVHFMATRAGIKLNTKKLYQANGFAVKELLKIAKVLYTAVRDDSTNKNEPIELSVNELFDISKKKELQEGRMLASQFASSGASLHALLGREVELRDSRDTSIRRQLDSTWVEQCVAKACDGLRQQVAKVEQSLVNITADEANLDSKIEKKRGELERNRKRLSTLQSVRPAYMEEYEQLEEELSALYASYITRFRNLSFLENQYEELMRSEIHEMGDSETTLRRIADQLKLNTKHLSEDAGTLFSQQLSEDNSGRKDTTYRQDRSGPLDEGIRKRTDFDEAEEPEDDVEDEDDDDGDDDDEDEEDSADEQQMNEENFAKMSSAATRAGAGGSTGRNQLVPGWSPSRQRIPAASYHGRPKRSFDDEQYGGMRDENRTSVTVGAKSKSISRKSDGLLESENEDLISNDGDEEHDDEDDDEDEDEDEDEGDDDLPTKKEHPLLTNGMNNRSAGRGGQGIDLNAGKRAKTSLSPASSTTKRDLRTEGDDNDF